MLFQDINPKASPSLEIPTSEITCSLSIIDTTCYLTVPADTLVEPVIKGHELMNFPTFAFLISHSASGKQILFDLGCRKDFWNLPSPIAQVIDKKVPGIRVDKNLSEVLVEGGVDLSNLEAAIISHHHYDHTGQPGTFPTTMDLVVGPGFSEAFLPGYPTVEASPLYEDDFKGRNIREIDFSDNFKVAGYRAVDYFKDGSLTILDTPGHAVGHISALVRTTSNTFVFLGGDICHFGGSFRPTPYAPMPNELSGSDVGQDAHPSAMYACSLFTGCHPDPKNARVSPYYKPCRNGWYIDPPLASQSIERLKVLDSKDNVLALIAHDPAIIGTVPMFPKRLDDWHSAGYKKRLKWRFLDELPVDGKQKRYLVDGTYMDGKLVKNLDGSKV